MEKLETIRLRFKDDAGNVIGALPAISIVTDPAIELPFNFFGAVDKKEYHFKETSTERMEITGPAMITDLLIPRKEGNHRFNVVFERQDIRDALELFMRTANHSQANFEHTREFNNKISLLEAWIVEDPNNDKAKALGFNMSKIPSGSLMITYKFHDVNLWNELKKSDFKGFSIEAGSYPNDVVEQHFSKQEVEELINDIESNDKIITSKYELAHAVLSDIFESDKIEDSMKMKLMRSLVKKLL